MFYGELGVYPLKIDIQARIVSFLDKTLGTMVYITFHNLYEQGKCRSNWLNNIQNLVSQNGYGSN